MAAKWYQSVEDMPLDRFIRALCNMDLKELIIEGEPTNEQLLLSWSAIYEQFLDGMQDESGQRKMKLVGEINRLEFDHELIMLCVQRLQIAYSPWIIETLRRHIRVTGTFNPEDTEQYMRDLQAIRTRAANMQVKIDEKRGELAILTPKGSGPTRMQFDRLIAQVSIFSKFHINRRAVMTSEFIELYKIMLEHENALKTQLALQKMKH
jgi:hypothetical protein